MDRVVSPDQMDPLDSADECDGKDPSSRPFNETTTLTEGPPGSASVDLVRAVDVAKELKEQVAELQDMKQLLLRFQACLEGMEGGLSSQSFTMQGVLHSLNSLNHRVDGMSRLADMEFGGVDRAPSIKSSRSAQEAPSPPGLAPPALPSFVKEEDVESVRSIYHAIPTMSFGGGSHRRVSEPQYSSPRSAVVHRFSEPAVLAPREGARSSDRCSERSSRPSDFGKSPRDSIIAMSHGLHGITEEIEAQTAKIIWRNRRKDRKGTGSQGVGSSQPVSRSKPSTPRLQEEEIEQPQASPQHLRATTIDAAAVKIDSSQLNVRRRSMVELQNQYDAVLVRANTTKLVTSESEQLEPRLKDSSLSKLGWMVLCLVGILDFRVGRLWKIISCWNAAVIPLLMSVAFLWVSFASGTDQYLSRTLSFLMLGTILSITSLRWTGLKRLLGPEESALDEFASESGFMEDWKVSSRKRLIEVAMVFLFMVTCFVLYSIYYPSELHSSVIHGTPYEILTDILFLCIGFRVAAVAYCQLHICSGLELSIDSFCFNFFKQKDIEQAIEEWNMVQANLRQVSNQLSASFFLTAASCLTSLLLLAEQTLRDPSSLQDGAQICLWLGWLYPPTFYFIYAMLRAASVTEKASRVGPLVNSWQLQTDEDTATSSMDTERQYLVQYINQSQAGFFMKGVRINGFDVQKMIYYSAALTFTLVSRSISRLW